MFEARSHSVPEVIVGYAIAVADGKPFEIIEVRYLPEYPTDDEVRESFLVLKFDV
jgi:hypothetical protein